MLDSLTIKNYRLFRHLHIDGLARVNLVVGKNNCGKSALLEAVEIYSSNASFRTLASLISEREERWNEQNRSEIQGGNDNALRHLFYGHRLPRVGEPGIRLGPAQSEADQLDIIVVAYRVVSDDQGDLLRTRLSAGELEAADGDVELSLMVQEKQKIRRIARLDRPTDPKRGASFLNDIEPKCPCQVVPTRNMSSEKVAALWDTIGLTDLAEEVVAGLQLIDSTITGLAFVESSASRATSRVPLVRTKLTAEPLPLKSMGDGMTRLFHITVALTTANGGVLLIDEFENGLHWSIQANVWRTVFRLAKKLNVQVFATTHSRDCVVAFREAWSEHPEHGAFYRLQAGGEGAIVIKKYSLERLADSLIADVEVR